MKAVIQRCSEASVAIENETVGAIARGLVLLVGIRPNDGEQELRYVADKIVNLRIFEDECGKMNRSLLDVGGEILSISQFTLYGDTRKGRRPSFINAARPDIAEPVYDTFNARLRENGIHVACGRFGADMDVQLTNDGPVTFIVEKNKDE